jgi:NAD(P)-dependent dehydrogenase (short-subunit alcohol dehydrogenase family)
VSDPEASTDPRGAPRMMAASGSGRVVVVTGASAGVGRATAIAFGRRGDRVALLARGEDQLQAAADDVRAAGGSPLIVPCDVADADAVEAAAERVERQLGPIDIWVNNAMTAVLAMTWDVDPADFRRVMEVTFLGYVHGTQAALRRMRPRNRGTILQVGSALSYRAIPLQSTYCAAKFAIRGFTDSLRCELRHEGSAVRVTMVQLPGLNTPQFTWVRTTLHRRPRPVAPVFSPEVAADGIVWAADHPRRELWIGGSTVAAILGNALVPGLADRYLARTNVEAQQDDVPIDPSRPDYLYDPLPGDRGVHGPYGDEAKARSIQLALSKHRRAVLAGAGAAVAATAATLARRA